MSKKIAYIAVDNGIDGMQKDDILYATWDEKELKALTEKDKSSQWRRLEEQIVDLDKARKIALSKLNGVDRLVLGLPDWLTEKELG